MHRRRGPAVAPPPGGGDPGRRWRAANRYRDFNDCHATEKLREVEGLRSAADWCGGCAAASGCRRSAAAGPGATAAAHAGGPHGALVQLDASLFAWLGDRGPRDDLHGAIDDATGTVLALYFRPTEDLHGYAIVLRSSSAPRTACRSPLRRSPRRLRPQ